MSMSKKYDIQKLDSFQKGCLRLYIGKLKELKEGRAILFETSDELLREELPSEVRADYENILEAGLTQARYLRASQTVDELKESEQNRLKTIDDFLSSLE